MREIRLGVLCAILLSNSVLAQDPSVTPMHIPAGSILTFYSQTRLNPQIGNPLDGLPKGTLLRVRLLDSIDSNAEADGAAFHGVLERPVIDTHNAVVAEEHAQVRGLLALLRSKNHPEGFRYELLLTGVDVNGKMKDLTAILNPTFFEAPKVSQPEKALAQGKPANTTNAVGATTSGPSNH
jgi:hypothetical protein